MIKYIYFLFLCFCEFSLASETLWLCKEESSQRRGNSIHSCGIGTGSSENVARLDAFDNAKREFTRVCAASDDCKGRNITVTPQRTSCEQAGAGFKCYRLLSFDIGELGKQDTAAEPKLTDTPDSFQSFKYEQIEKLPKVKRGMSKKALLAAFGAPESVQELSFADHSHVMLYYTGKMCFDEISGCSVNLRRGQVVDYDHLKPIYTEDLK